MSTVKRPKKKKRRRLKPGLWFGPRKVEVEVVKKAHKALCCMCRKRPGKGVRVVVQDGTGRHQTTRVFCAQHGIWFIEAVEYECTRAAKYIVDRSFDDVHSDTILVPRMGNVESIRPPVNGSGDLGMDFLKEKARERAKRKSEREAKA